MWYIANIPVVARNHALVICGFLLTTLSVSCVILRTISRTVLAYMRWEDWLAILATLGSVGFLTASMFSVSFGLGDVVLPNMLRQFLEARLATIAAYNFTQLAVKFSTLIQYKRIFTLPLAQRVFTYLICWLSIYTLPCLLLPMFPCWPVAKYWDQSLPGQCINQGIPQYTLAGINVFNDLAILIAPWPFLRALRFSSRERIALIAVFGCGVFVCLVAVLRLYTIYQFASATDEQKTQVVGVDLVIWSGVEINMAIICTSVPTLRLLARKTFSGYKLRIGSSELMPLGHASSGGANGEMTRETEASRP